MSGSFKNKLLRYETVPPPGLWENISIELDKEFVASDSILSSKIENASITPPPSSWHEIESFLHKETSTGKVVPFLYKRIAIAVILVAFVAASAMYIFTGNQKNTTSQVAEIADIVKNNTSIKIDAAVSDAIRPPSPAKEIATKPLMVSNRNIVSRPVLIAQQLIKAREQEPEKYEEIDEAYFSDMHTVQALQPVNVPARPIRDANGNIIMDVKLISKPNDPYITVTGPNGSQTKISNKFINCLSYLNKDISAEDTDYDGMKWKDRFKSWSDKLLSEASFVPTANNFFDIFEMKDLIQE